MSSFHGSDGIGGGGADPSIRSIGADLDPSPRQQQQQHHQRLYTNFGDGDDGEISKVVLQREGQEYDRREIRRKMADKLRARGIDPHQEDQDSPWFDEDDYSPNEDEGDEEYPWARRASAIHASAVGGRTEGRLEGFDSLERALNAHQHKIHYGRGRGFGWSSDKSSRKPQTALLLEKQKKLSSIRQIKDWTSFHSTDGTRKRSSKDEDASTKASAKTTTGSYYDEHGEFATARQKEEEDRIRDAAMAAKSQRQHVLLGTVYIVAVVMALVGFAFYIETKKIDNYQTYLPRGYSVLNDASLRQQQQEQGLSSSTSTTPEPQPVPVPQSIEAASSQSGLIVAADQAKQADREETNEGGQLEQNQKEEKEEQKKARSKAFKQTPPEKPQEPQEEETEQVVTVANDSSPAEETTTTNEPEIQAKTITATAPEDTTTSDNTKQGRKRSGIFKRAEDAREEREKAKEQPQQKPEQVEAVDTNSVAAGRSQQQPTPIATTTEQTNDGNEQETASRPKKGGRKRRSGLFQRAQEAKAKKEAEEAAAAKQQAETQDSSVARRGVRRLSAPTQSITNNNNPPLQNGFDRGAVGKNGEATTSTIQIIQV